MLAYLEAHITMTVATVLDGQPQAATLFYANDGLDLVFVSDLATVHARAMVANPGVAVTISQDYPDWQAIQGIQARGHAHVLEDAPPVYARKFPFIAGFPAGSFRYWRITPTWLRLTDNTRGFAHKDELTL
jgi:hypothetical protein